MRRLAPLLYLGAAFLSGCSSVPKVLDPAGPVTDTISQLFWVFLGLSAVIWMLVLVGLLVAAHRRRDQSGQDALPLARGQAAEGLATRIVVGLAVLTSVILVVLTLVSFFAEKGIAALSGDDPLTIEVTGNQWWWQVRYQNSDPSRVLSSANEIHVPVGRPIKLVLRSNDVIHSFWIPQIAGKQDLITGRTNELHFTVSRPGTFTGQCAEFCGFQHAHMRLVLIADEAGAFGKWYAEQLKPAKEPQGQEAQSGKAVFLAKPCVMCHTISGTLAAGKVAPDLTHFASRKGIAANTLPMTRGALAAWIADPQAIKPGAHMPRAALTGDELNQLVAYLEQLQ